MKTITCLTDYKNQFGSKWKADPYRSGLDLGYLSRLFLAFNYDLNFSPMTQVDFLNPAWKGHLVLYTSSEECGLYYKGFIEDVVFGLKEIGANLMPDASFLRANNNKVFMEILRQAKLPPEYQTIPSQIFGTYDELDQAILDNMVSFPCVIKKAAGAMSRGVFLANNGDYLRRHAKKICRTRDYMVFLREKIRVHKYAGYNPESEYQGKFIIQPFISGLKNDWKILIYGEKYFILRRNIRENDFRASGSGYNYTSGSEAVFPIDKLNLVREFYLKLDVPNLSIDFAYDGERGYIFEFQAIHFGTSTHYKSKDYYEYVNGTWHLKENNLDQEQVYVHSIVEFLKR